MLALVRDADAPSFYEDLIRYWTSINDVTGRRVIFAVAGGGAAERLDTGAIYGKGYYSEQMAVAGSSHAFKIEQLRQMAGLRRNVETRFESIAEANTEQISELCEYLGVEESDLPCLHLTHLSSHKSLILPLSKMPGATIYTTCKAIISHLQPAFRSFNKAASVEETFALAAICSEMNKNASEINAAQKKLQELDNHLQVPSELRERNELFAYFRRRLNERPEHTPIAINKLIKLCENPRRMQADQELAQATIRDMQLIPRLKEKALRIVTVSFSSRATEYENPLKHCDYEHRWTELTAKIAELELKNQDLHSRETALQERERKSIAIRQAPALKAIEKSFLSLPAIEIGAVQSREWDIGHLEK